MKLGKQRAGEHHGRGIERKACFSSAVRDGTALDFTLLRRLGAVGRRGAIFAAAPAPALLHGFEFLFLLIVENRFNLGLAVLPDRLHLRAAIFAGERLILKQGFHLLLAIDQQGFDLALLIGTEVQLPGHVLKLLIGVHAHAAAAGLAGALSLVLGWGRVVLGERGPSGAK